MRHCKVAATFLLLTVFLLHASIIAAQEIKFSNEMNRAREKLATDLASPLSKHGLETIVFRIHQSRMQLKMNGYEVTDEYSHEFHEYYNIFRKQLWKEDFQVDFESIDNSNIEYMEEASESNAEMFEKFISVARGNIPSMQNVTTEIAYRSQLYFSLILLNAKPSIWERIRKATYIYPLCKKKKN